VSAARKEQRRRDLAAIHCLKRDLGLDDEEYRDVLWTVARVRSAGELDSHGRQTVLDHMRARQQKQPPGTNRQRYPGRHSRVDRSPQLQKIEAQLTDMGLPWSYADALAQRMAGVRKVAWVRRSDHLRAIISALGYEQEKRALLEDLDARLDLLGLTRAQLQAHLALRDGWDRNPVGLKTARMKLHEMRERGEVEQLRTNGGSES